MIIRGILICLISVYNIKVRRATGFSQNHHLTQDKMGEIDHFDGHEKGCLQAGAAEKYQLHFHSPLPRF